MPRILLPVLLLLASCTNSKIPHFSPSATLPDEAFRTSEQHDSVMSGKEWPYIWEADENLLYFGSWHTNDPGDPQIGEISRLFEAFKPSAAVTENAGGRHLPGAERAVRALGEFGQVIHLAREAGIPVYSLEPTWEDEIGQILERYSREEATVFYTLRVYLQERGDERDPAKMDKLALHLLGKRGTRPGLDGAITTLEQFDAAWRASFGEERDWRTLPREAIWRRADGTLLQRLAEDVNLARDRHAVRVIMDLVDRLIELFSEEIGFAADVVRSGCIYPEAVKARYACMYFLSEYYGWRNKRIIEAWFKPTSQATVTNILARCRATVNHPKKDQLFTRLLKLADIHVVLEESGTWSIEGPRVAA